jgi:conjugal transfer pilus assembly protein TraW
MRLIIAFLLILAFAPHAVALQVIEGQGRAYPIEEESQSKKIIREYQKQGQNRTGPEELEKKWVVRLETEPPAALEDSTRVVDISYTVPFDIPDETGKVLIPKGYVYNPLAKINMTSLIVIDGENEEQIEWARQKQKELKKAKILISRGSFLRVMRKDKLRVYHLDDRIMERMQIRAVPCTVVQKGQNLEISEYRNLK